VGTSAEEARSASVGEAELDRLRSARAQARALAWAAGAAPEDVIVDFDATPITAHSDKELAAGHYKGGFGFNPLLASCGREAGGDPAARQRRRQQRRRPPRAVRGSARAAPAGGSEGRWRVSPGKHQLAPRRPPHRAAVSLNLFDPGQS